MNYQDFVHTHRKSGADITVAALPTDEKQAAAFGLMKINDSGKIIVSPGLWRAGGAVCHADSLQCCMRSSLCLLTRRAIFSVLSSPTTLF